MQAAAEGVEISGYIEMRGKRFRLGSGEDALLPMMEFASVAAKGAGAEDMGAMASMFGMLRGCFMLTPSCGTCEQCDAEDYDGCPARDEGDWPRFLRFATATGAGPEEVFEAVNKAMEQLTARPTVRPAGSSPPAPAPPPSLRGISSGPGTIPEAFRRAAEEGDLVDVGAVLR